MRNCKLFVGICLVATMAVSGTMIGAPSISSVFGTVSHDGSITISGSGFGSKSPAAPVLWDTVDNQSAYSGLSDEDEIPVTDVIDDIYDAGNNYGMALSCSSEDSIAGRASEHTSDYRPSLEITHYYGD